MAITSLAPDFPPVRVGLIGAGRHARQILLPALALVPELQLAAVSTAHEETARDAEQRYRVPAFVGYERMLKEAELEAVLVVGGQHCPEMLASLAAGRHVWCETPCVTSSAMADDVRASAQEAGRLVEVGSCLRHAPIYRRLKKELDTWRRDCPGPRLFQARYYPYVGHFYNLLLWLNGPIREVCAAQGETETLVLLRFENGDLGSVTARRFHNNSVPYEQVAISGEDGLVVADNGQELRRYRARTRKPAVQLEFETSEVESWSPSFSMPYGKLNHLYLRGYVPELEHFARRVRKGEPCVSGIDDMAQTLRVREAVDRSAEARTWVNVDSPRMNVPFIDLRRFEPGFLDRWAEKCREITEQTRFVGGPEVARLEATLAEQTGAAAVVGCANGTDAIQLALRAAGVGPGDRVLIPDATFWATFEAVVNVGAQPQTVDISLEDLQMDFDLFREAALEVEPQAAVLVHLYGWASRRLDDFRQFCAEQDIALVEDAAQAFGVTWNGASIFRDAYLSTASFYPAKVLGSCGDAGAVFCSTRELADAVRVLGDHGRSGHYGHSHVGWNSRMGGFDASYLNLCLEYFPERLSSRQRAAARLRDRFDGLGIRTSGPPDGCIENGYLSVTLHEPDRRPAIAAALREAGVGFGTVYPGTISAQPGAAAYLAGNVGGPNAELLGRSVLNPPLFAYIRDEELDAVVEAMAAAAD